jgi:hypothetical protein
LFAVLVGCLVIGCASSVKYTTQDGGIKKQFSKSRLGSNTEMIDECPLPWDYTPLTVLVSPETRAAEFTTQWIGVDKSVVLRVFGEPAQKVPYPNGFSEECWYYLIRNTKWFVFFDINTNKVIDIQYQIPGQPLMTTESRMAATQISGPAVVPISTTDNVPQGYKPYKSSGQY